MVPERNSYSTGSSLSPSSSRPYKALITVLGDQISGDFRRSVDLRDDRARLLVSDRDRQIALVPSGSTASRFASFSTRTLRARNHAQRMRQPSPTSSRGELFGESATLEEDPRGLDLAAVELVHGEEGQGDLPRRSS
jgi:hypothetical protein